MKHYWVTTPDFASPSDPEGPHIIVECVAAENKVKAKGIFVSQQHKEYRTKQKGLFYEVGSDNPFVGLKVQDCLCVHGVCNCEFTLDEDCELGKPRHPDLGYCGDCYLEGAAEQAIQAYRDWAAGVPYAGWQWEQAVEDLFRYMPEPPTEAA